MLLSVRLSNLQDEMAKVVIQFCRRNFGQACFSLNEAVLE